MPTYEYHCSSCKQDFSAEQRITDPPIEKCLKCGKKKARRMISKTSFELKGKGWFKDGY